MLTTQERMVITAPESAAVAAGAQGLNAAVDRLLNRRAAVGMAIGVIRRSGLDFFRADGVADITSRTPVSEDTVFRIGSITKTFTAVAILQLLQRGLVELDAPANDYLRAYQLIPAKSSFRPVTLRHLLTHTGGIREVLHATRMLTPLFGETVDRGRPLPALAEFYRGGLRVDFEPGVRWIYSDHGFATLGQVVEDVSGMPLQQYMRERIFQPLGMFGTDLVRSEGFASRVATGYEIHSHGPVTVTERQIVTVGAGAAYSTPRDVARYVAALLNGGANEHGSVLEPTTVATMFAPHHQPDVRLPGMGLAFWRFDLGGHRAVEHGGIVPGFTSQIYLAPDDGVGVMAFTNGGHLPMLWLPGEAATLLRKVLGAGDDVVRSDVPQRPETWSDLCGWYPLSARLSDVRARLALGAGVVVAVRGGRLVFRCVTPMPGLRRWHVLHPDDPGDRYAFRLDLSDAGLGTSRVVFSTEPGFPAATVRLELLPELLRRRSSGRRSASDRHAG